MREQNPIKPELNRESKCGFSLVEVVVATAIFALLITGVFGSLLLSNRVMSSAYYEKVAFDHVQSYISQLKSVEYEQLITSVANGTINVVDITKASTLESENPSPADLKSAMTQSLTLGSWNSETLSVRETKSGDLLEFTLDVRPQIVDYGASSFGSDARQFVSLDVEYRWSAFPFAGQDTTRTVSVLIVDENFSDAQS